MKIRENVVKGWVTSAIGLITMVVTIILIYKGIIDFTWDGLVGLVIGALLLTAPKTIEKKISEAIGAWGGKSVTKNENQGD
tara:strand:+ start:149 stop:391 length:243 start_codon:yes stop_codon:yes gene_type:complete